MPATTVGVGFSAGDITVTAGPVSPHQAGVFGWCQRETSCRHPWFRGICGTCGFDWHYRADHLLAWTHPDTRSFASRAVCPRCQVKENLRQKTNRSLNNVKRSALRALAGRHAHRVPPK